MLCQGSDYVSHLEESLARERVLLTASYRMHCSEGKGLHGIPQAITIGEICCFLAAGLVHMLNFVSSGLLTYF